MEETARISPDADDEMDLEDLFKVHGTTIARWATRLSGPDLDPAEVVQEVYLVAARRRLNPNRSGVKTWLFRTTSYVVRGMQRRQQWRRWLRLGMVTDDDPALHSPQDDPSQSALRLERLRLLYRLLGKLPQGQRDAMVLFELEGLSIIEIAKLTKTKSATVRVHIHRARKKLLALYEQLSDADREVLDIEGGKP